MLGHFHYPFPIKVSLITYKRFWNIFVLYLHKMFSKKQKSGYYMLIKETTKTLAPYIAVNNINKAGSISTQWNNLFAVSCWRSNQPHLPWKCKYSLSDTCWKNSPNILFKRRIWNYCAFSESWDIDGNFYMTCLFNLGS